MHHCCRTKGWKFLVNSFEYIIISCQKQIPKNLPKCKLNHFTGFSSKINRVSFVELFLAFFFLYWRWACSYTSFSNFTPYQRNLYRFTFFFHWIINNFHQICNHQSESFVRVNDDEMGSTCISSNLTSNHKKLTYSNR